MSTMTAPHPPLAVRVVQLDADLPLPALARSGDAGLDLRARVGGIVQPGGGRLLVPTGLALAIPDGYAGFVLPRSGNALRHGVTMANSPGLIDSGYRDELQVILINTDPVAPFEFARGDRIGQLVIQRVEQVAWDVVEALDDTERGLGGFGHSGRG
jgi:dUTP pyrophosphatase